MSPAVLHDTSLTISLPDTHSPLQVGQASKCPHMTPIDLPLRSMKHQILWSKQDAGPAGDTRETQPVRYGVGPRRKPDDPLNMYHRSPPDRTHLPSPPPFLAPPKSRGLAPVSASFHHDKLPPDGTKVETVLSTGYFKVFMVLVGFLCFGFFCFSSFLFCSWYDNRRDS